MRLYVINPIRDSDLSRQYIPGGEWDKSVPETARPNRFRFLTLSPLRSKSALEEASIRRTPEASMVRSTIRFSRGYG